MNVTIREKASALVDRMSPRTRQFATLGAIAAAAIGILWAVFSMSASNSPPPSGAAAKANELKPTNVDLMAPGAQVSEVDNWVGKAGRKLDRYETEREEQRRLNREAKETEAKVLQRLGELEARLKNPGPEPAKPAASVPASPQPAAAPPAPARFPPDAALARANGLPAAPPAPMANRPGMPQGVPPFPGSEQAAQPALVRVTLSQPTKAGEHVADGAKPSPQTVDTFLPVSFTRGTLLGGLDAPTGGQSQSNPHPVLIRLSDTSVLPNRHRADYRECFVIASGYGDISSERAYLRTGSLSCIRADGTALELKIEGNVYGEDGKYGMRGRLVTKQGQMLLNGLMAGVMSGIGQGISTANTTYSTSALGQVATTSGSDAMRAGVGSGVGKALDRLAQYYIKLAEQTFPVIEIDAGREIDVVITKGVRIDGSDAAKASPASHLRRGEPTDRYLRVNDDEE
jgi:conjugal transfer pilus assembly protein TraB